MTDEVENLVLEHLKRMQAELAKVRDDQKTMYALQLAMAHQIINSSAGELRYIAFANHGRADVIDYPDSGKVAVAIMHGNDREPASFIDVTGYLRPAGDYWEGEDLEGKSNG